jgi:hypothetical protein
MVIGITLSFIILVVANKWNMKTHIIFPYQILTERMWYFQAIGILHHHYQF